MGFLVLISGFAILGYCAPKLLQWLDELERKTITNYFESYGYNIISFEPANPHKWNMYRPKGRIFYPVNSYSERVYEVEIMSEDRTLSRWFVLPHPLFTCFSTRFLQIVEIPVQSVEILQDSIKTRIEDDWWDRELDGPRWR